MLQISELQCCSDCESRLPFVKHPCIQCGLEITAGNQHCGKCLHKPPPYDDCFCPYLYEAPIQNLIQKLKYAERPETAKLISRLFYRELIDRNIALPELLVPVPLHRHKLRQRGFNQSLLLVKHLSRLLNIPYSNGLVIKTKSTAPQVEQSLRMRSKNVKNSFRLSNSKKKIIHAKQFKHIAIVDDVITTGATVGELANLLKQQDFQYISVWGVAHTM